jgi:hypothetical protein
MIKVQTIIICQVIILFALAAVCLLPSPLKRRKEFFALPQGMEIDKDKLDPEKWYLIGQRQKSNTIEASQGGAECIEYPDTMYLETQAPS